MIKGGLVLPHRINGRVTMKGDLTYLNGLTRGQQIMVDTMRRLIASKASHASMAATLDLIEKQLKANHNV